MSLAIVSHKLFILSLLQYHCSPLFAENIHVRYVHRRGFGRVQTPRYSLQQHCCLEYILILLNSCLGYGHGGGHGGYGHGGYGGYGHGGGHGGHGGYGGGYGGHGGYGGGHGGYGGGHGGYGYGH